MTSDDQTACLMIVDDEAGVRMILRDLFESRDYRVVEADDGQQAIDRYGEQAVDLVITDVNMPTKGGLELLQELHARDPGLPVIMITGKPTVEAAVECIRTGATDFITKPFDLLDIAKRVDTVLAEQQRRQTGELDGMTVTDHSDQRATPTGYQIVRTLGQGNMGTVYLVKRDGDDEPYAMKVLRTAGLSGEQKKSTIERFRREAEAARIVVHENVVRIVDYGTAQGGREPYIVMEYLRGRPLKLLISRDDLALAHKAHILRQVASALGAIHAAGICHRDIKPGNIMVDEHINAKLTDFGIARLPDSDLTMTSSFVGSPAYMSPEAYVSAKVDWRADIFSFGIVAYEFILGRKPFGGDNLPQMMNLIRNAPPPDPLSLDPTLPADLAQVLLRCLDKDPKRRYQSAQEIAHLLAAYC